MINEIRVYEVPNLFEEYAGQVTVSADTSPSVSGFEAQNLLDNLQNRSCGNDLPAIKVEASYGSYGSPSVNPVYLTQESCYEVTEAQLAASGYLFVLGFQFEEPVFMHAITHVANQYNGSFVTNHTNKSEYFQNYEIYIGNSSNYNQNPKCPGGPFLRTDDDDSYVEDDFAVSNSWNGLGQGVGMVWPYGAENWCNMEGSNLHIVADLSHLVATSFTASICTVGVFGTKYVRDGDALPTSLELTEDSATATLTVPYIYSALEIGT